MFRYILLFCFIIQTTATIAQENSTNGWYLPTNDTLRVLMVFVEVEYDTQTEKDPSPQGNELWAAGKLPSYADSVFDVNYSENLIGKMTKYYLESSLGNFVVLGDYLPDVYKVKMSEIGNSGSSGLTRTLSQQFKNDTTLFSNSGLGIEHFDYWENTRYTGRQKVKSGDAFTGVDHVMVLARNFFVLGHASGMASGSSFGLINGKRTDSYSLFAGGYKFPFSILRHELNHLLIGGNNFHAGGGNSAGFKSYFPFVQGGWGMMGGAHSSLLTCSGWDRYWLGWKAPVNEFLVSARSKEGLEVNGDIDRKNGTGIYILRDFATDGDALRIKLPFIPKEEFQQWLWIENHTTKQFNGSEFDVFQYENHDCIAPARAGLYMHLQIDANEREAKRIYGKVNADYLRPILADGNYDFKWEAEPLLLEPCVNGEAYIPYYYEKDFENPLTGNHAQEYPQYYTNFDTILTAKTVREPNTRRIGNTYERIAMLGNARHGFREGGNNRLGIGTNPSSANMLSLVNTRRPTRDNSENNRKIYINGLHIEILQTLPDASLVVEVRFDDNIIDQNRRWCAPEIVLNNHIKDGPDLIVKGDLKLDIGETMTRFDKPISVNKQSYFTNPTHLIVKAGAEVLIEGSLTLTANSKLIIEAGGVLTISDKAKVFLENGSEIRLENGAKINGSGTLKIDKTSVLKYSDSDNRAALKKMAKPRKRVVMD